MKKKFFIIYSIIFIKLCGLNTNVYAATSFDCNSLGNLKRDLENFFNLFKVIHCINSSNYLIVSVLCRLSTVFAEKITNPTTIVIFQHESVVDPLKV